MNAMPKMSKRSATVLIIIASLGAVYGSKFFIGLFRRGISAEMSGRVKGNDNAPIKVTEFIDFQCPACAQGAAYLKEVIGKHPQAIRLELKHYPLQMHRHGLLSAMYAECAARQGKFWPFHDMLLARQGNWARLADARPAFERIADEIRLSRRELDACVQDETTNAAVEKNRAEGKALGIRSTPTYFVNGKMVVGKAALEKEIGRLLKEKGH